jgi:hypothetical protein
MYIYFIRLIDENPLVAHNLTEVRYLSLKSIAKEFEEDGHVDEAMRVYYFYFFKYRL